VAVSCIGRGMFNDLRCEVILFVFFILLDINVREYRRGNQKLTSRETGNTGQTRQQQQK
jgi:hypothetical protein